MRHRSRSRGLLVVVCLAVGVVAAPVARARQAAPAIDVVQVRPNVHVLFGAGANVTVHVGEDGLVVVDSGTRERAADLLAAVRRLSPRPVRLIINTSADADHVGGNAALAAGGMAVSQSAFAAGAAILAHENVLNRMSAPTGQQAPFPVETWPTETYISDTRSMYLNDDGIQIFRQPGAHSDGDSLVHFRRVDLIATGDVLDLRQFPLIDPSRGGSVRGELAALNRLIDLAIPAMPLIYKEGRTLVVPGHGRISDQAEIVEYRDMVTVVRDRIQAAIDKGLSLAQVQAANPTQGYRARYGADNGAWTTGMFVEAIYRELSEGAR